MGAFAVGARVWNVHEPTKAVEVDLSVDAGAAYTVMPAELLGSLGVSAVRVARLRLADGGVVERRVGEVGIGVEGFRASATPVIFGDCGIYLLGSVTMEQLGLAPDPVEKRLKPVEALLMGIQRR